MNKLTIIPITKEFERESLIDAVVAYMTPNGENERIEVKRGADTYTVCVFHRRPKKTEWLEGKSVQLSFDKTSCRVSVNCPEGFFSPGDKKQRDVYAGGAVLGLLPAFTPLAPLALPGVIIGTGISAKINSMNARKFIEGIIELVKSYVSDKEKIVVEINPKKENATNEKNAIGENHESSHDSAYICTCGKKLEENQKFCPECGTPRDDGMRTCTCGQKIEKNMKFCPYCGGAQNEK